MIYYVIESKNGFEETVFKGTRDEAEQERKKLESCVVQSDQSGPESWLRTRYYVVSENEWQPQIGGMH